MIKPLPYIQDSSTLFAKLQDLPWAVYLDSCQPFAEQGRFDIISAYPHTTLVTHDEQTTIATDDKQTTSTADPFQLVQQYLFSAPPLLGQVPFNGGAIGYFAYDLAQHLEKLPRNAKDDIAMPDMAIGIYDWGIVIDHRQQQAWLLAANQHPATATVLPKIMACLDKMPAPREPLQIQQAFSSNMDKAYYADAFQKIKQYIYDGDCYQVNLTQRFTATVSGCTWQAYQQLRQHTAAPYAGFLRFPQGEILSLSPERFLKVNNGQVETKPAKGTRPRGKDTAHDQQLATTLLNSKKDRAENLMIVDLLRNDLGKVCETGSIEVPKLFDLESFPSVHHLISTITGKLASDKTALDALRACFPGGSITGAPKIRAMEIIAELEPEQRSAYCGAIGYISYNGNMDTNIAIRTMIRSQNRLYCSAGGGLVADSDLAAEYQETLDKVTKIIATMERYYV